MAAALFASAAAKAQVVLLDDPLHGFCVSQTACSDNGTNTPITTSQNFGFTVSPGPATGTLFLVVLIPDFDIAPATLSVTGAASATATLVSVSPWTTLDLSAFVGQANASPANPLGAFLPSSEAVTATTFNGFFVLRANLGTETLNGPGGPFSPVFSLGSNLPLGSYIVAFFDEAGSNPISTAASGALFEVGQTSAVPEPATWGMLLLGFIGLGFAFRNRRKISAFA
jgi:hypothetical protein